MTALYASDVATSPLGTYAVEILYDEQGPDASDPAFVAWDRETLLGEFAPVEIVGEVDIALGERDLDTGAPVLPASLSLALSDTSTDAAPGGAIRTALRAFDLRTLYVRVRSVDAEDAGALDWFGRVQSIGKARPVNTATAAVSFTLDAACGLTPRLDAPAAPTVGTSIARLAARLCHTANPHLPLRLYLDVSADGQPADGSGYTSAHHLRYRHERAGRAFVPEGAAAAPDAAEGDYGDRREVLDLMAGDFGWRVFQHPAVGEWWCVPETMLGEAIAGAERAVYGPAGGTAWDAPGVSPIAADLYVPTADEVRDADDTFDEAERLSAVVIEAGGNLVSPTFATGTYADGEEDAENLIVVPVEAGTRIRVTGALLTAVTPGDPQQVDNTVGSLLLQLVGDTATAQLGRSGLWDGGTLEDPQGGGVDVVSTEPVPFAGRLRIVAVGETADDETEGTIDAQFSGVRVALVDEAGDPITTYRYTPGDADEVGAVEEGEPAPGTEYDADGTPQGGGAGNWQVTSDYSSRRWGSAQSVLVEYAAEARLRRRAEVLDALDGALRGLHGPARRVTLSADDVEAPASDPTAGRAYVMGSGCVLHVSTGWTEGVWAHLPDLARDPADLTPPA